MRKFENYLQTQGYITRNVDYPSSRYPIERLAEIIAEEVEDASESTQKAVFTWRDIPWADWSSGPC